MDVAWEGPRGGKLGVIFYRRAEFFFGVGESVFVECLAPLFKSVPGIARSAHHGHADGSAGHVLSALDENDAQVVLPGVALEAKHGRTGGKAGKRSANFTALVAQPQSILGLGAGSAQAEGCVGIEGTLARFLKAGILVKLELEGTLSVGVALLSHCAIADPLNGYGLGRHGTAFQQYSS